MDIYYISDLHLEFRSNYKDFIKELFDEIKSDINLDSILVLAGDISNYNYFDRLCYCLDHVSKFKYVIFVSGNHEYYSNSSNMEEIDDNIEKFISDYDNIYFLNNDILYIENFKFIGSTLWTNVDGELINDFNYIYINDKLITKDDYNNLHDNCKKYLKNVIDSDIYDIVVISHHVPSFQMIHKQYKKYSDLHKYFNVDMEYLFDKVKYWICGHTHKKMRNTIDNCDIMINPVGYPNENYKVKLEKV